MLTFITRTWNVLTRQHNQHTLRTSLSEHKKRDLLPSGKVIEYYVAPPSFFLKVWALFPLLLVVTLQPSTIAISLFATIVNLVMIHHLDTFRSILYFLCGLVLLLTVALYRFH